jgi:hypothetical protein
MGGNEKVIVGDEYYEDDDYDEMDDDEDIGNRV